MNTRQYQTKSRWIFMIFQIFNGLSAAAGGGLMDDPTGQSLQMDASMLASSPFHNFLIPGIVLFVVNGIGNVTGAVLTMTKYKFAAHVAVFFGLILMGWIVAQVVWVGYASFLQPLYFATGLVQSLAGYIYIRQLKKL